LCTGCRLCEIACSLFHRGAVNPEGSRVWVVEDWDRSLYEPHICQLCHPAPCTEACPLEALTQEADTGIIRVDATLCNGCLACVQACPYGAIRWSDALNELLVCDRCGGEPACLPFCHRGALRAAP
ncbi:MAG: 4Fe-4S dicluster domain-containing protein, partial [Chloroflexota bacterium]